MLEYCQMDRRMDLERLELDYKQLAYPGMDPLGLPYPYQEYTCHLDPLVHSRLELPWLDHLDQ